MSTWTIRKMPDALHRLLKDRARTRGRRINSEAIACLEAVLLESRDVEAELSVDLRRLREEAAGAINVRGPHPPRRMGAPVLA